MELDEYQSMAFETAIYPREHAVIYPALGMASEAGEALGKLKKVLRDKDGVFHQEDVDILSEEIGDVLWYIAALCTDLMLSLDDVAAANLAKLKSRKERGVLQGDGDNR